MNLLILANEPEELEKRFEGYFEEIETYSLVDVMIDSSTGSLSEIKINGEPIDTWDSVYIKPEPKAFNYTRVLMETLRSKNINCNLDPSSVFILTKKAYLFNVLADKSNSIPRQASISTEKGMTELEKNLEFPTVAKKYSELELAETKIFDDFESLKNFAELTEHGKDYLMIQEHEEEKEIFDILYIDGTVISLKLEGSPWRENEEVSYSYHGVSDTQKEIIEKAVTSIGTNICRARLRGQKIMDMDTDPQLEKFKQESGKNVYGRVADFLKGEEE